jgi:hypothetical protein
MATDEAGSLLLEFSSQLERFSARAEELAHFVKLIGQTWSTSTGIPQGVPHRAPTVLFTSSPAVTTDGVRRTKRDYDYFTDLDIQLRRLNGN